MDHHHYTSPPKQNPPKGWLDVPKAGSPVDGLFLPIRALLDDKFDVEPEERWTPEIFVDYIERKGINVGLIINLCGHEKYYKWRDGISRDKIYYEHIPLPGRITPHGGQRQHFIETCNEFLHYNPGKVIAVHCTHGANRTGFMICNYLCDQRGWGVEDAISYFSVKRPPGIYQDYCLMGLRKIYTREQFSRGCSNTRECYRDRDHSRDRGRNLSRDRGRNPSRDRGRNSSRDRGMDRDRLIPSGNPWRPKRRGGPSESPPMRSSRVPYEYQRPGFHRSSYR